MALTLTLALKDLFTFSSHSFLLCEIDTRLEYLFPRDLTMYLMDLLIEDLVPIVHSYLSYSQFIPFIDGLRHRKDFRQLYVEDALVWIRDTCLPTIDAYSNLGVIDESLEYEPSFTTRPEGTLALISEINEMVSSHPETVANIKKDLNPKGYSYVPNPQLQQPLCDPSIANNLQVKWFDAHKSAKDGWCWVRFSHSPW